MKLKSSWGSCHFSWLRFFGALVLSLFSMTLFAQKNPIALIKETIQVGGADAPSLAVTSPPKGECLLNAKSEIQEVRFNTLGGAPCLIKIYLNAKNNTVLNLEDIAVLSFRIRGEKDVQNFKVGLEASGEINYVGSILEYLPRSVVSTWHQTGIPIREFQEKGAKVSQSQNLVLNFEEPAEGTLQIKEISFIPRKPFSKNWEPVVVLLPEYQLKNIFSFKTMSLGHYGQEFGWKVAQVYRTLPERSFASHSITMDHLKSKIPDIENGLSKVADFNTGLENQLGGYFNEFQKAPSHAFVTLTSDVFRGESGKSLKIDFSKKAGGFSGAWVHFFDFKLPPKKRVYVDATPFKYLSLWIRGEKGGEDVSIQLSDASWEKTEDSVYYGKVKDFLPKGITAEWQEVKIPLRQEFYKNLNFKKIAGLTLNFREVGEGTVYVDDIALTTEARFSLAPALKKEKENFIQPQKMYKAMWLWHTVRQLKDRRAQDDFFKFCQKQGVNLIFFQMQYSLQQQKDKTYICFLKYEDELKRFIERATSLGIEVHSLDGFSRFALKPWHEKVLAEIRAVIDYNKRVPSSQRFSGIHHDNEPYLIPGYWGFIREEVMHEYLELCEKSQKLVHESGLSHFVYGVDIPFWYEELNFDFDVPVEVTWKGTRKSASFHIIDMVDNVGIMDYRTKADGADGTLVHGRDEIQYANTVGKKVLIGIETYPLPPEIFAVFRYNRLIQLTNLEKLIENDPRQLFMFLDQSGDLGILYLRRFREDLKDTPRAIASEISKLKIEGKKEVYRTEIGVDVPSSKLSFAGMDKDYFLKIYQDTVDYFKSEPSFAGMAIHYYETYRQLMGE